METQENLATTQNALNTEPDYGEEHLLFREMSSQKQQYPPSGYLPRELLQQNQENISRQSEFQKSGRLLFSKEADVVNELLNDQAADSDQIFQKSSSNNIQNMMNLRKSSQEERDIQNPSELTNSTKRVQFADPNINMKTSQRMNNSRIKQISKSSVLHKDSDIQTIKHLNNRSQTNENDRPLHHHNQVDQQIMSTSLQFNHNSNPLQINQSSQIKQRNNMQVVKKQEIKNANNWLGLKARLQSMRDLVRNLEMTGMLTRFSKVQQTHLKLISDKGSDLLNEEKSQKQQSLLEEIISFENVLAKISIYLYQVFRFFPTLNPSQLSVVIFKIILALQLVYQIFQFPLMIAYPDNYANIFLKEHPYIRICFSLSFFVEIFLNFNVFFFEHGERVNEKLLIIANYLKKDFFVDTLGMIGTLYVDQGTHYSIVFVIFFLRLMKFYLMYDAIEEKFQLSLRFAVPYTLINLIATITVIAHIFGCIFYYIATRVQEDGKQTWITKNGLENISNAEKYVISLYFSFITMITVGYGDITPVSYEERIFVIFMTLFSCGIFGFVVSSIGNLFAQMQIKNAEYKQQKYEISNYMETRSIDNDLKIKVFQTLETMNIKKQQEPENGQFILESMHSKLRESIYQNYYGKHLMNWKLFSSQFSSQFLESISVSCKEQIYGPGEVIFYQQESNLELIEDGQTKFRQDNQNIYLIVKGKVVVYQEALPFQSSRNKVSSFSTKYSDGECFGVKEFFCGIPYESTAHSIGLTSIIKIERSIFLAALQRFPKDYEQFAFMKDQLLFNNPEKYMKCQACKIHDHSMYQCPRMHFMKRRLKAILVHNSSYPQIRASCSNSRRSKLHAVSSTLANTRRRLKLFRVHFIYDISLQQLNEKIGEDENNEDPSLKISEKFAEGFNARAKKLRKAITSINNSNSSSDEDDDEDDEENGDYENSSDSSNLSKNGIKEENEEENPDDVEEKLRDVQKKLKKKSISKARKQFLLEMKDLKKNMDEQEDEMFYFRCPIVIWDENTQQYTTSFKIEEEECNEAIQQYLESNFNVFLNNEGSFTCPKGLGLSSSEEEEEENIKVKTDEGSNNQSQMITQVVKTNQGQKRQLSISDQLGSKKITLNEKKQQIDSHKPIIDHTNYQNTNYNKFKPTKLPESTEQDDLIVLQDNSLSNSDSDYLDNVGNSMKNFRKTLSIHQEKQNNYQQEEKVFNGIDVKNQGNNGNTPIDGKDDILNLAEINLDTKQDNKDDNELLNKLPRGEFQLVSDLERLQNSSEVTNISTNQPIKGEKKQHLRNAVKLIQTNQKEKLNHPEKLKMHSKQSIKVLISMSQDIMNNIRRKQLLQAGFESDSAHPNIITKKQRNTYQYMPNHQGNNFDTINLKKSNTHTPQSDTQNNEYPLNIQNSTQSKENIMKEKIISQFKLTKKPRMKTNLINITNILNRKQNKENSQKSTISSTPSGNSNSNNNNSQKEQKSVSFSQDNIYSEKSQSEQDIVIQNHHQYHKDESNSQTFFSLALDKPADFTNFYPKYNMQLVILKYIKYQEKRNINKTHRQIFTPNIKSTTRARNIIRKSNSESS